MQLFCLFLQIFTSHNRSHVIHYLSITFSVRKSFLFSHLWESFYQSIQINLHVLVFLNFLDFQHTFPINPINLDLWYINYKICISHCIIQFTQYSLQIIWFSANNTTLFSFKTHVYLNFQLLMVHLLNIYLFI